MSTLLQIFETTVMEEFVFLQKNFGFNITKASDYLFVAKSSNCHVVIDFDKNVIGCWIERLDVPLKHPDRGFAVEWIAKSLGYQDDELRFLTTEESIKRQTQLQARLLGEYCTQFLQGNFSGWQQVFEYINEQRKLEEERIAREEFEVFLSETRQEAESSWLKRDYARVITLFETMDEFLTPSERKKLEYSKKHL
ncbi:MAG: hypothetical protein L0Z71_07615 [Anaerolineae bacterium]|nr:hypothetical protein [Anaerolineae bacterium]